MEYIVLSIAIVAVIAAVTVLIIKSKRKSENDGQEASSPHGLGTQLMGFSSHPQAWVSAAPAWQSCQRFEVDASLPDAAMETKG